MQERPRFRHTDTLAQRLTQEAARLRRQANGTPPGIERERLISKARYAEAAGEVNLWLSSPGMQAPR